MYGEGRTEGFLGAALAGRRKDVYLVSKAYPQNASRKKLPAACEASLRRLKTDYLDLYLLHWPGPTPLAETLEALQKLKQSGKIAHYGVSNFDVDRMKEALRTAGGDGVATDQVLYNLSRRGAEWDLLPWMRERGIPVMAYSPVEQGRILDRPALRSIASRRQATPAQVALAWLLRNPDVFAIPKAATVEHVRENRAALDLELTSDDLRDLEQAFPAPTRKRALEML